MNDKIIAQAYAYLIAWQHWLMITRETPDTDEEALARQARSLVRLNMQAEELATSIVLYASEQNASASSPSSTSVE